MTTAAVKAAAEREGRSVSAWVRDVLRQAAADAVAIPEAASDPGQAAQPFPMPPK